MPRNNGAFLIMGAFLEGGGDVFNTAIFNPTIGALEGVGFRFKSLGNRTHLIISDGIMGQPAPIQNSINFDNTNGTWELDGTANPRTVDCGIDCVNNTLSRIFVSIIDSYDGSFICERVVVQPNSTLVLRDLTSSPFQIGSGHDIQLYYFAQTRCPIIFDQWDNPNNLTIQFGWSQTNNEASVVNWQDSPEFDNVATGNVYFFIRNKNDTSCVSQGLLFNVNC